MTPDPSLPASELVERAIAAAESKLGAPYVWATAGPDTFDCSGFTWWVASQVLGPQDHELRSSHHQFNGWGVSVEQPRRGDLVFFRVSDALVFGNHASHVGLALGHGRFIHAANESTGVIISELGNPWYDERYLGARRIFDASTSSSPSPVSQSSGRRKQRTLRVPDGPIRTRNPWNGDGFGAAWADIARWAPALERAAREQDLDVRLPAVVMAIETQGIHERDGEVLHVWDLRPQDGPAIGIMQVKRLHEGLLPDADIMEPEGNIRLGTAVLRQSMDRYGSFENAIARGYHPGVSPHGVTPTLYVAAARGLLEELGYAA